MPLSPGIGFWLLVVGCGPAPALPMASDRAAYTEALAKAPKDPEAALALCAGLVDPALRGDCQTQAVVRGRLDGGCVRVDDPMWRDECWFQVADDLRTRGKFEATIEACELSGRFEDNCVFHIWQQDILRVIRGLDWEAARHRPPVDGPPVAPKYDETNLVEATAAAEPIYQEWQARLGADWRGDGMLMHALPAPEGSPFADVFWGRFYVDLLERAKVIDLQSCASAKRDVCEAAMVNVAVRRMRDQRRCGPFDAAGWQQAVPLAQPPDAGFREKLDKACAPF